MDQAPEVDVEIRWSDVDAYGHVSHIALVGIAEHARSRWLDALMGAPETWDYVIVHMEIDFREPAEFIDRTIRLRFEPVQVGRSSVRLREVLSAPDGRLIAELVTVIVAWDRSAAAARPLTPQELDRLCTGGRPVATGAHPAR